MSVPYEIEPQVQIPAAGSPVVVEINWPHRSVISKIIVVQTEGVGENFTVALYNHSQVVDGAQVSDSVGPYVGKVDDDLFRVTPDLQATAGKLIYFSEQATGGYGYVVFNHNEPPGRQKQRENKVYLKITPTGGSAKKYAVALGGMKEVE